MAAAGTVMVPIAMHSGVQRIGLFSLISMMCSSTSSPSGGADVRPEGIYVVSVTDSDMPAMGAMLVGRAGIGGGGHGGLLRHRGSPGLV